MREDFREASKYIRTKPDFFIDDLPAGRTVVNTHSIGIQTKATSRSNTDAMHREHLPGRNSPGRNGVEAC